MFKKGTAFFRRGLIIAGAGILFALILFFYINQFLIKFL